MAVSLLHLKAAAASALSRSVSHGTNLGIQAMRGYSIVAGRGLSRPEPKQADDKAAKQADDKAATGYRQSYWMPDPVTGYYIPEDHFGEFTDIAEDRQSILKYHSATSDGVSN